MTPTEAYDALLNRITTWAFRQECGKGAVPQSEREAAACIRHVSRLIEDAQIFHLDTTRHQGQTWFLEAKAPITVACTGNKWGKTYALLTLGLVASLHCVPWVPREEQDQAYALYSRIKLKYEPPVQITLAGPDFVKWLPMNIIPRLKKLIPWPALVVHTNRVQGQIIDAFELFNGSIWQFLSYAGEPERFESWSGHLMLWDEPMVRNLFIGASRGSVEFGAPHVMSFTPENLRDSFTFDEIYDKGFHVQTQADFDRVAVERPRVVVIGGTLYDNPFISREDQETQVAMWSEHEKESRVFGRFRTFAGRVYPGFSREKHVRELAQLV